MPRYASSTSVRSEKSRVEIESTLRRYGADGFMYGWESDWAMISFKFENHVVKFKLPLPSKADFAYSNHNPPRLRATADADSAWEQACRQRWRALALVIKAKLEAVESGITCFEDEFLAHMMIPGGRTFGEWAKPQFERIYAGGHMPKALLPGSGG